MEVVNRLFSRSYMYSCLIYHVLCSLLEETCRQNLPVYQCGNKSRRLRLHQWDWHAWISYHTYKWFKFIYLPVLSTAAQDYIMHIQSRPNPRNSGMETVTQRHLRISHYEWQTALRYVYTLRNSIAEGPKNFEGTLDVARHIEKMNQSII